VTRRPRIINQLRALLPGRWTFDRRAGSRWSHESGRAVRAYAQLSPKYDGDDESFRTVYRWEDTGEEVRIYGGLFRLGAP